MSFLNPFSDERERILGRIHAGHTGEALRLDPRAYSLITTVDQRVQRLETKGWTSVAHFSDEDRQFIGPVFLYQVYHRYLLEIDALIQKQLRTKGHAVPVPFARELLGDLDARGFGEDECLRYFAIFYQLRRAFYFILVSLVGDSVSMRQLRRALWDAVFTHEMHIYDRYLWNRMEEFSTLLLGETGTGKGSAAAAIGRSGLIPFDRKSGRFAANFGETFIAINLSQFPESLIESELFGHRKGAFTGAIDAHAGVFERCNAHGALFLDEIGEVGVPIQIKLLQVLQERTFTPLGSHENRRFAGRVIAATNRPLDELRGNGNFREDFFYRLCSNVIAMPTLRRRIEESPAELEQLVNLLVNRTAGEPGPHLTDIVLGALHRDLPNGYPWPGNVRELEQAVRRILLTGHYGGETPVEANAAVEALARDLHDGALDARTLLARYCALLYQREGSFEKVARRTGLDRRTVKKYIESTPARQPGQFGKVA